jgi:hypothetical protein
MTGIKKFGTVAGVMIFAVCVFYPGVSKSIWAQVSTTDHLADPGFWPTKNDWPRTQYVGEETCSSCHKAIFTSQKETAMNGTAVRAEKADILRSHKSMEFSVNSFRYEIKTDEKQSVYKISDGPKSLSADLLWAFGTGRVGQSYLFKKNDGRFYEARVTYFDTLQNLNFTPDRALTSAKSIEEAMYRPVDAAEVSRCFACHATAPGIGDRLDEQHLIPGITCEACHGPGVKHVSLHEKEILTGSVNTQDQNIFDPAQLSPTDSVDFCGSCHGTWWDVKLSGVRGVSNVKSQPYRLENSRCWGKGDARLTCVACHDPHKKLQMDAASYDTNCLACHQSTATQKNDSNHPGAPCPVSTRNCSSCHMPKVYVPEMHTNFTDHKIRIVKKGDTYQD